MYQIEIYITDFQTVETTGKSSLDIAETLRIVPDLAGDEKILSGNSAFGNGTANAFFIFINRSGIDHAVAGGNSRSDCCFGLYVIGQLVYAKPQKRHFSVVVQKNSFFQNNSSLYVLLSMLLLL